MPKIKSDVLVMHAMQYQIVDKETGEVNEATNVRYAFTDNVNPFVEDNGQKGYKVAKARVGYEDFAAFTAVPGIYSADLEFKVDTKDGSTKVAASNFKFKGLVPGAIAPEAPASVPTDNKDANKDKAVNK